MNQLFKQIKWQFLIFQRNNLIAMIIGVTAFYMLAVYLLMKVGNIEKLMLLLIFNEPTMVGFIFIGIAIILEKDQGVFSALFVTPMNTHIYLISKILTLSSISLICAFGMVLIAKGTDFNLFHFTVGAFFSCVLFSFVGIYVVSFTKEILHYILYSIPLIVLMSLPLFNYFGLTDFSLFTLFPVQGCINLVANSYSQHPYPEGIIFGYISIAFWVPLLYWFVYRRFRSSLEVT